jgi:hypothetical protein
MESPRQEISVVVMLEGNSKAGRHQENVNLLKVFLPHGAEG